LAPPAAGTPTIASSAAAGSEPEWSAAIATEAAAADAGGCAAAVFRVGGIGAGRSGGCVEESGEVGGAPERLRARLSAPVCVELGACAEQRR
jgi:hypothetical protein